MKNIVLVTAMMCVTYLGRAQTFEGSYIGDAYYNAAGGLKTGGGFMGMGNITMGLDTWRGGSFFVNGASIHGKSLTENYLGDLQVASNIDAGEHTYLHELWFRQQSGPVSFTLGLQDLNAEFMVSEGAGEFINSSFGVPPVIATQVPVPIFPLTGLGIAARWDIGGRWAVQGALFDGNQTSFDHNPHNVHWRFCKNDGMLAMGEVHFDGRFKLGAYYHSAADNYGVYALADQPVGERWGLFGQVAVAPKSRNENNFYAGAGVNYTVGEHSHAGMAVAHAGLHNVRHKHETAIEAYYKYELNDNIAFQPDVQYILNPSGRRDALVAMLRSRINF
jgi:porin